MRLGAKMRYRSSGVFRKPSFLGLIAFLFTLSIMGRAHAAISYVGTSALADSNAAVMSITIGLPAGVQAGDCLIAQIIDADATGSSVPVAPNGWTFIRRDSTIKNGDKITSWLYYKVAGPGEPSSHKWNIPSQWVAAAMGAWRGAMPSPIDTATGDTANGQSPLSADAPWSNAQYSDEQRLFFFASQAVSAPAISLPTAITPRLRARSSKEGFALAFGDIADSVASSSANYAAFEWGGQC